MFKTRIFTAMTMVAAMAVMGSVVERAAAEPILQIYLEGGTYNEDTESWTLTPGGSSSGESFRVWAIGNVGGSEGKGTIHDVRMAFSYDVSFGEIDIRMNPTTVGGDGEYNGFTDPSVPDSDLPEPAPGIQDPYFIQYNDTGDTPKLGDGSDLPSHGVYGDGVAWQEYGLGDFSLTDSEIADFTDAFPDAPDVTEGQINAYDISVHGSEGGSGHGIQLHIDLYNHVMAGNSGKVKAKFAPFSHDADGDVHIVPVPAAAWGGLVMLGMLGGGAGLRRRLGRNIA